MEAATKPLFQHEAEESAWHMTHLSTEELKRSLKLSPKLALESYKRFQDFHATDVPGLQAFVKKLKSKLFQQITSVYQSGVRRTNHSA